MKSTDAICNSTIHSRHCVLIIETYLHHALREVLYIVEFHR